MTFAARRKSTRAPKERRDELLRAARKVFEDRGLPAATVADITAAAGVAKGTFYLYFESKEALLGALKRQFAEDLVARAAELYARVGKDDWWALADVTVESMVDFLLDHRDLVHVFAREGMTPESEAVFAEADARLLDMFAAGIKAGTEAGAYGVADPMLTASFLSHAVHGTLEHAILYEGEVDRDRILAGARDLFRRVLAP